MKMARPFVKLGVTAALGILGIGLLPALVSACDDSATGSGGSGATGTSTSGGDGGCTADPFVCADGETCVFADAQGSKLECRPAGPNAIGDACKNIVGSPSCAEDLICLQLQGQAGGECVPFCNMAHPCDVGTCTPIQTAAGKTLYACYSPSMSSSSSSSGGSTSSSASSSSSGSGSSSSTGP
ncbi:MAG: hypothetical protein U0414_40210 [Polyangiaceae bacterium]